MVERFCTFLDHVYGHWHVSKVNILHVTILIQSKVTSSHNKTNQKANIIIKIPHAWKVQGENKQTNKYNFCKLWVQFLKFWIST